MTRLRQHPRDTPVSTAHIRTCHHQSARPCPLRPLPPPLALVSMPDPAQPVVVSSSTFVVSVSLSPSYQAGDRRDGWSHREDKGEQGFGVSVWRVGFARVCMCMTRLLWFAKG